MNKHIRLYLLIVTLSAGHSLIATAALAASKSPEAKADLSDVRLLGTIMTNGVKTPSAVLVEDVATGRRRVCTLGEPLGGGTLRAIERGRVSIQRGDRLEYLELPEGAVESVPETARSVSAGEATSFPKNKRRLEAYRNGFSPLEERGQITGIQISRRPIIGRTRVHGLRKGDIIRGINGQPITSAEAISRLSELIARGRRTPIEIERHGMRQTIMVRP